MPDAPEPAADPLLAAAPIEADRPRPFAIGVTALGAVALLVAGSAGFPVLLALTLALSLLLAWSWPTVSGTHTPEGTTFVLTVSAVVIVLSALRDDLLWIGAAVVLGIILSFFAQLRRSTGREGLVLSLLSAFGGLVLIASGTTAIVVANADRGRAVMVVAMGAALAALLGDLLAGAHLPSTALGSVALVAATVTAGVVGLRYDAIGTVAALLLGAAVGAVSWALRRVLAQQPGIPTVQGQIGAGVGSLLAVGAVIHLAAILG